MEELLKTALTQVPSLTVLAVLVYIFVRTGASLFASFQQFIAQRDATYMAFMKQLNDQHLEARESQRQALVDNTNATRELAHEFNKYLTTQKHENV